MESAEVASAAEAAAARDLAAARDFAAARDYTAAAKNLTAAAKNLTAAAKNLTATAARNLTATAARNLTAATAATAAIAATAKNLTATTAALDVVMDLPNAVEIKIEASDQNAQQIALQIEIQQYSLRGFKPLAKYNNTDEHVVALTQFIRKYKVIWCYIHSIESVLINIRDTILAAPRQDELCKLLFAVVDLGNIFNKHLSSREVSFFMVQVAGQLLVNVSTFRTSNATEILQQMIYKVKGFHLWNLPMIKFIDPMASMIKTPSEVPLYNHYRNCHIAMCELLGIVPY
jgi:hypothetical protein